MTAGGVGGPVGFVGGTVWCGVGVPEETALVAVGSRITAVGEAAHPLLDGCRQVVDLGGGFLMPAFGDGHAHPMFAGLQHQGPAVAGRPSIEAIVAEVARWAGEHPDRGWIIGGGYDPALQAGGEFDARLLDAAVPDRPVVLRAADYHTVWCNTAALRAAGVDATTPDPRLGEIVRREDGTPRGTLREWHAVDLILDRAPAWTVDDQVAALFHAGRRLAAAGITWVQDAWVDPWMVAGYREASRRGALTVRTNLALRADPDTWRDQLAWFAAARAEITGLADPLLTCGTVKFFADGVVEGGTAAMLEPYEGTADRGMPVWSWRELSAAAAAVDAAGFQVHIHAIGDAAIRAGLDAVEACARTNGARDRRPVLTHVQVVDPTDLPRFTALDVIANVELLWAQPDPLQTVLSVPRLGPVRTDRQYPYASLVRSGAHVSAGSDWPVSDLSPLATARAAVTRRTADGAGGPWLPHERLTVEQALHAYTAEVAHQAFAGDRGRLAPGTVADLVHLDADPRTVDPMALADVVVRGTWLAGRRVA